ncbi:MAG TPA: VanW family protein [Syntrophomonadaceae bacterium]|nr:VanW family protein [Syntrophomonadaceae bacterium]
MESMCLRPKTRSRFRFVVGTLYFCIKRYRQWFFSRSVFARNFDTNPGNYPCTIFHHRTPLYRRLRNTDMWLQQNKVINLRLAVAKLNCLVLRPGETFSFWRLLGKPTKRKGYVEGMVLYEGRVVPGIGGGLCQLSNLIYWMTLHTPLTVVERWRHNYDVFPDVDRTQPFGSGATVVFNYIDLQIRNDTEQTFYLRLWLTDTHLCGEWRSDRPISYTYQVYEKEHLITHEPWGYMRHNRIHRRILDSRQTIIADEMVAENHAIMMYPPMLNTAKNESSRI